MAIKYGMKAIGITTAFIAEAEATPPGEAIHIELPSGKQVIVMDADDFDHILKLAMLGRRDVVGE